MEMVMMSLAEMKPAPYNPRKDLKPGDPEYEQLKRSIQKFDYVDPLIVNTRTGHVVGGHQRLKILKDLGWTEALVSVIDVDDEHEKALNLALNRVQGAWNEPALAALLEELRLQNWNVTELGFSDEEIDRLVGDFDHEAANKEMPLATMWRVVVNCQTEIEQATLLERLKREGYDCQAFVL